MRVGADSLLIRAAAASTSGTLGDLTADLIMANNNNSATVIVRAGGAIWLNPFSTVLFSVCSAVIVECCVLYPCCMGVFGMFAVM